MDCTGRLVGDLFIRHQVTFHDAESRTLYDTPEIREPLWVVNCRNPRAPHKTCLPLGFATYADAERAMLALLRENLATTDAMHHRIKVEHDWASVQRIMIEALNW
jgi:hypothetical protein